MSTRSGWAAWAVVAVAPLACGTTDSPMPDAATQKREVAALLSEYGRAYRARDEKTIRSLYVTDDRFAWYEEGALRYRSVDDIVQALAGFPAGMTFETSLDQTDIVLLGSDLASVRTLFDTVIHRPGGGEFRYDGSITMLAERAAGAWRILSGHTSSRRSAQGRSAEGRSAERERHPGR